MSSLWAPTPDWEVGRSCAVSCELAGRSRVRDRRDTVPPVSGAIARLVGLDSRDQNVIEKLGDLGVQTNGPPRRQFLLLDQTSHRYDHGVAKVDEGLDRLRRRQAEGGAVAPVVSADLTCLLEEGLAISRRGR